jgi:hypothetical protein
MRFSTCSRIWISMEGQEVLGRSGKTCLLVISSLEEVFLICLIWEIAFEWGL